MGRTGICYDNAMAESFFAALKNERINRTVYPTREHARKDITRYIEFWYNTKRLHSNRRLDKLHGGVGSGLAQGLRGRRASQLGQGPARSWP